MTIAYSAQKVKNSLRFSTLDGSAFSAMLGLTQNYITPFALALKASTPEIGLLSSIPNLSMALAQLAVPTLSEKAGGRLKFILLVVFFHALMWIPIMLIPFVFHGFQVWWLIGFLTISTVLGALANPAWGSMMADLVPQQVRGRYFSFRGRIAGVIVLVASLIAGWILQIYTNNIYTGFAIIFCGAAAFRFLSLYYLSRMYEPPAPLATKDSPGIFRIFRQLSSTTLGKFTIYVALINFATMLSGPFFAVFMLRDLNFSYTTYMIVVSTNAVANLAFQTFWGRRADMAGNMKVIKFASLILPILPLFYVINDRVPFLMCSEVISGFAWGGFNLAISNYVFDASTPEYRTKQIAVYNAVTGIAICLGALIGGFIAPLLPSIFGYELRTLFTLSGGLRALIVLFMLHSLVEVRRVPSMNLRQFLRGRMNPEAMKKLVTFVNKR